MTINSIGREDCGTTLFTFNWLIDLPTSIIVKQKFPFLSLSLTRIKSDRSLKALFFLVMMQP